MATVPGDIDVNALMSYLKNLQSAQTTGPLTEEFYDTGDGRQQSFVTLDGSYPTDGGAPVTGGAGGSDGSELTYTERAMLANGVSMEEIMRRRQGGSQEPPQEESNQLDLSRLPLMYAGGLDLNTQLAKLGTFLGQDPGTEGRGLGIGASAGAFALGATRSVLSGLAAQKATNRAEDYYDQNKDRRTYTPNPLYENVGGGNLYPDGGMHMNSDVTLSIENKDKMEHLKKYFPNGGVFGGKKDKEPSTVNPYEEVDWLKEEPVARPVVYDYQKEEAYQKLNPYQKNIIDYQKGHRFGFDVNQGVWVEQPVSERTYDYEKDISTPVGGSKKGYVMSTATHPYTGESIRITKEAVTPLVGTFGESYKRFSDGGEFKTLFNY